MRFERVAADELRPGDHIEADGRVELVEGMDTHDSDPAVLRGRCRLRLREAGTSTRHVKPLGRGWLVKRAIVGVRS